MAASLGVLAGAQVACSSMASPSSPKEALPLLWAAVPWVLWPLLSAVGAVIVFLVLARERRVRVALLGSTLIACALALWPPYPWGLARAGLRLKLEIQTADTLRAARDEALAAVKKLLQAEGAAYSSAVPAGDASFALEGLDALRLARTNALCASVLGPAWSLTEYGGGRIEAHLTPAATENLLQQTMTDSVRTIERRLNQLGAQAPSVRPLPRGGQIEVDLFEVEDVEQAKRVLLARGQLSLQLVEAQAPTREALLEAQDGQTPEGQVLLPGPGDEPGETLYYLLGAQPIVTGRDVRRARAGVDQLNQPAVNFTLNARSADKFGEFTAQHIGRRVAIVLDGRVESAPTIQGRIGADGQITGRFTALEADDLARILSAGALPAGLSIQSEAVLPPGSIVSSVLRAAVVAAIAAVMAVLIFLLFYRVSAIAAGPLLLGGVALTLTAMIVLQRAVTLPGVAVLVLALGLALDRALASRRASRPGERADQKGQPASSA